jgi:hypothetical protein
MTSNLIQIIYPLSIKDPDFRLGVFGKPLIQAQPKTKSIQH